MTDKPAVLSATFTEWKMVKTRKALQLIFEVPLEHQEEALRVLGTPMPDKETWVAIARLADKPVPEKERVAFADKFPAQQAGILCADWQFRSWLKQSHFASVLTAEDMVDWSDLEGQEQAALIIRTYCGVNSRKVLSTTPDALEKWEEILTEYKRG